MKLIKKIKQIILDIFVLLLRELVIINIIIVNLLCLLILKSNLILVQELLL
jgi:hypothetical protein